ncbi:hypothetical protein EDD52_1159 [Primorskyibacter sedentarius]|uniref:PemK-like, MazF-like toxin of type II toxin-antitoxin system n=1 Tax=Primorskyibacter sedentarius TaxID=745311 RepID=A0A4R3J4N1_9RHOB|nr:hypothetical protein [Primorskyibacter sedentarius]TCS60192.1 hypothetical protein EDD52_1159 [Primorskyibacter sedentarius]
MYHQSHPILPADDDTCQPERGDVVLFRFPVNDGEDEVDGPKRRPCLVLDTFDCGGERFVELAYGTSAKTKANRGYEILVKQAASRASAGLDKPTRFVGARRTIVHINDSGSDCLAEGMKVIGHLDNALLARMNAVRARIQAEADIAAHYREENCR